MYAGVEIGGTKVVIAYGTSPDDLSEMVRIPTTTPHETVEAVVGCLKSMELKAGAFEAIGIASFGPVGVSRERPGYGFIRKTPKPGWSGFDLLGAFRSAFPSTRFALDTDVASAALGEVKWGVARGSRTVVYVTVGTGIGGGIVVDGKPLHGTLHPEVGHVIVRRDPRDLRFAGCCPFHGDCLEGLASGPSLEARTGVRGEMIGPDNEVWDVIGGYLGQLYYDLALTVAPDLIVVGGSVGLREDVINASRTRLHHLAGGYIEALVTREGTHAFLREATFGDRAGILGAIALAANPQW